MPQVGEFVRESSMQEGLPLCSWMHITSSVFSNDDNAARTRIATTGLSNWLHTSR
jgi:thiamine phosphate synthase YjbQ (UPF0047 family)